MRSAVDVIVVGSGASGSWAAKELSERGIDVLVLEAGRSIRPERDYADPSAAPPAAGPWQRLKAAASGQHIQARCGNWNPLTKHFFVDDRKHPYSVAAGSRFLWFRGRQEGGRMHTWGRIALRLSDVDFKAASRDGYGRDWPIGYDDLEPYYDRVETFLGLHGATNRVATLPDGRYVKPWPLTRQEIAFRDTVETGWPECRVLSARIMRQTSRIPLPLTAAKATGHCRIQSNAVVQRIEIDPRSGNACGVRFLDRTSMTRVRVRARAVVLCASTFESIRILLNSACSRHPDGLGNRFGLLGRGIMDNTLVYRRGTTPCFDRIPVGGDHYDTGRGVGFFVPQFRNVAIRDADYLRGFTICGAVGRGSGHWWLASYGSMLPYPSNRLRIHPWKRDAWGIPVVHIDLRYGENEWRMIADQKRVTEKMLRATGLHLAEWGTTLRERRLIRLLLNCVTFERGVFLPGSAIHECGGAPMGSDPSRSVLNSTNQCWDAPNVFVTDGASFVTCPAVNLTNTIMAVTVRACHHLIRLMERGEL